MVEKPSSVRMLYLISKEIIIFKIDFPDQNCDLCSVVALIGIDHSPRPTMYSVILRNVVNHKLVSCMFPCLRVTTTSNFQFLIHGKIVFQ